MEFKNIMHVSFFTDQLDEMIDFYTNKLGGKLKIVTKAKSYINDIDSNYYNLAKTDPEKIIIVYIELAPLQFVELFPKRETQDEHEEWNKREGYSHFSLLVEDIYKAKEELEAKNVALDTPISIGNSKTYKMWIHDPDGNKIEVMQFTDESLQIIGNVQNGKEELK